MTDHKPKWPHLENLDKVPEVLAADVMLVTEKIDGFNARFGRTPDGEFWVGTRNQELDIGLFSDELVDPNMAQGFAAWAWSHREDVDDGVAYFGEWAGKGIQNRIDYGDKDFHLFGVMTYDTMLDEYVFVIPNRIEIKASFLDIKHVPILHWGKNPGLEQLEAWRRREGTEGIVIFPWPMVKDQWGNTPIAKFKNPNFEERKSRREDKPITVPEDLQAIVEEYVTWERMLHVFGHIQMQFDRGIRTPWDIEHTGTYLQVFHSDVTEDAKEELSKMDPAIVKQLGKFLNPAAKRLRDEYVAQLLQAEHGGEA